MDGQLEPKGPVDPDLTKLTAQQFEDLVFLLAHAQDERVVPVKAKDQGLDARLPTGNGRATARGWQAKHHAEINWSRCEESVRSALSFWRPPRITFAFSADLSAKDQEGFRTHLIEKFPHIQLDFWGANEIKRRMRETKEGRRAQRHFFGDPKADIEALIRAAATGQELSSTDQAFARIGVIHEYLQDDPHFAYGVVSGEVGSELPSPTRDALLSVEVAVGDTAVRIDASERYQGASEKHGPEGAIVFEDPDAAKRGREEIERVAREGGSAVLDAAAIRMSRVPERMREFFPDDAGPVSLEVSALPESARPKPQPVSILLVAGGSEYAVDMSRAESGEGVVAGIRGGFGGLEVELLMRERPDGAHAPDLQCHYSSGRGTTLEQLMAVEVMLVASRGETLELLLENRDLLGRGAPEADEDHERVRSLEARRTALEMLAEIEAWTGEQLRPPSNWSKEELETLSSAIGLVRRPFPDATEDLRVRFHFKPGPLPVDTDGVHQFIVAQDVGIELFGREIDLGTRVLHIEKGRFVEVDAQERTGVVAPADDSAASLRLFGPGERSALPPVVGSQ